MKPNKPGCPCLQCKMMRSPFYFGFGSLDPTPEEKVAEARERFITEEPAWTGWVYTAEWFEKELDEIMGVIHARYKTKQMRKREKEQRLRLEAVAA